MGRTFQTMETGHGETEAGRMLSLCEKHRCTARGLERRRGPRVTMTVRAARTHENLDSGTGLDSEALLLSPLEMGTPRQGSKTDKHTDNE